METVELYFTKEDNTGGTYRSAGHIYPVPKHQAEQIIEAGKAKSFSFSELDRYDRFIQSEYDKYEEQAEKIRNNGRLTDEAKAEDLEALYEETKKQMDLWNGSWKHSMEKLKEDIIKKSRDNASTSKLTDGQINERVGLIISELTMKSNSTERQASLYEALEFIETDVARRLLSRFPEVKALLDENKSDSGDTASRIQSGSASRRAYAKIKEIADDGNSLNSNTDFKILKKIEERRGSAGHYPYKFRMIKDSPYQKLKRQNLI